MEWNRGLIPVQLSYTTFDLLVLLADQRTGHEYRLTSKSCKLDLCLEEEGSSELQTNNTARILHPNHADYKKAIIFFMISIRWCPKSFAKKKKVLNGQSKKEEIVQLTGDRDAFVAWVSRYGKKC